ncbi:MAG: serine/threonine protein kinase [Labilithrix sp.]|nr:serine/threonine protein kinase [Labilithrix sp.]MCW5813797.1 serine/threonine protein kinase [Labilithrix sp.]
MSGSSDELPTGTTLGRYRLEELLGAGGMGAVYRARHLGNDDVVAIKVLRRSITAEMEARQRFFREGPAANKVKNRGTVRVLDSGWDKGHAFLVMDLLEGETVEQRAVANGGTLPVAVAIDIVAQLLDVLASAHANGTVHRDIKPENLFLEHDLVKVLDFGIARVAALEASITQSGAALGTPAYMAPEQAQGRLELVGPQTDLWAAGATLFRLLTGRYVYAAATPQLVQAAAATQPPPPIRTLCPKLSRQLAAVIDTALAPSPRARWADALTMLDELCSVPEAPPRRPSRAIGQPTPASSMAPKGTPATPARPTKAGHTSLENVVATFGVRGTTTTMGTSSVVTPERERKRLWPYATALGVLAVVGTGILVWQRAGAGATTSPASSVSSVVAKESPREELLRFTSGHLSTDRVRVTIDGEPRGELHESTTPFAVTPGDHEVRFECEGYQSLAIRERSGGPVRSITLRPEFAHITVTADRDARVVVRLGGSVRKLEAGTPIRLGDEPELYVIVERANCDPVEQRITIERGRIPKANITPSPCPKSPQPQPAPSPPSAPAKRSCVGDDRFTYLDPAHPKPEERVTRPECKNDSGK